MKNKRTWGPKPNYPQVKSYKRPDDKFIIVAGPCSVESCKQIWDLAGQAAKMGATHLRGGVFRAGTYPGDNFGLVDESLMRAHKEAAFASGLKNIMEVLDYSPTSMHLFDKYASCFQIGARSMQNYTLLKKVSSYGKTIFLKRGIGSTLDEWLGAAEYILRNNCDVVLIERGSSTFLDHVRWDLSISMIPAVKAITDIPIIVDASHGTGRRDLVEPMTLAGVAAGADGLLCEIHNDPDKSLSDSEQAIKPQQLHSILNKVHKIREIL